ncbi:ABC1 family-domain-containing protein [Chaetomium sp. MPI-SDFR-AT-0129]|uniref:ABC1 family-domain-containing protein n=1 Tax=Dichotomopilus funicola TaxID=1934379 RepID=A0AAN6VCG5_9PEZI|nr:ABC1 family-domain-containing protein [Chaetomium sp. MPI-SDFR-AT-0129]KAK4148005.1 ABC1 family-domain-containing protein [Dichotomopilus funicola]
MLKPSFPPSLIARRLLGTRGSPGVGTGLGNWTCARCRGTGSGSSSNGSRIFRPNPSRPPPPVRQYGTARPSFTSHTPPKGRSRRRITAALLATAGGGATAMLVSVGDDVKNSYEAMERSGRVASTLWLCINDYRTTLNQRETLEDEDEKEHFLKACHKRCADRTLKVLEKNGGIFIKLGQHLSAMNYLLPAEWTTTFIPLQDKCPVSSFESIEEMFRKDTGSELWDYFSEFSPEPIGAASLAQVHLATIKDTGQKVAVKVQHPSLQQWAKLDMSLTTFTFSMLKRFFPEYDLEWLSSEIEVSLPLELNFVCEAENSRRTKEHFSRIPELPLVIPNVIWAKRRILVMACEAGRRLDDLAYLDSEGIDRDEVSATLARVFNEMIFGDDAPLHCDPHGGNIAIRKNTTRRRGANFDLILYDHGLYRDIPQSLRRSYAKMWLAIIDGDIERMKKYVNEVAGIGEDQFPLFASAITGRDFSVVSSSITAPKDAAEQQSMSGALQDGLLVDLVQMLGQVPRIILLILKTNDLTRSLDENLHTRQGPARQFLILARYCMRTVFYEQLEEIRACGSLYWPPNALRLLAAWLGYVRVGAKLEAYELWIRVKRVLGYQNGIDLGAMA